ncbi:FlgO family outer membrane protein [Psychrosphaera sp. 1_MG-2023]|uniref:FlgO family outer membrane protein n=1 Tax=unclassified Psychrosphaera TaxID=2641570 RepID=UPI002090989C|nr:MULTISPECIES: FlgO family outer membrane protein [unclassified Psychrosphaera]MDO6718636.1 FlgO family outer membrane protein [Psychrosphaera sp. 1_MG-2023]
MKKVYLSVITTLMLSGCATMESWSWFEEPAPQEEVVEDQLKVAAEQTPQAEYIAANPDDTTAEASVKFQQNYRDKLLNKVGTMHSRKPTKSMDMKNINYYVRGLMHDLVGNLQYVNASTPIAVTSFVFLDSDYEKADLIGKQLSESFIHEVHKFGIPVLDYKTTDYIRVSPDGDFILSKDYLDLSGELPIKYALTGTLVKHLAGYMVNARVIGLQSKAVVASAQGFLPSNVINSLISSNLNDGIPVTAGE